MKAGRDKRIARLSPLATSRELIELAAKAGLTSPELLSLFVLRAGANSRGTYKRWVKTLAEETRLSKSALARVLKSLETRGLIYVDSISEEISLETFFPRLIR